MDFRRWQRGQATVEYVIVTGALITALLAAVYESREGGDKISAIDKVEETYRLNYQGYSYAMSLSTLPENMPENEFQKLEAQAGQYLDEFEKYTDPNRMNLKTSIPTPDICDDWSSFPLNCL